MKKRKLWHFKNAGSPFDPMEGDDYSRAEDEISGKQYAPKYESNPANYQMPHPKDTGHMRDVPSYPGLSKTPDWMNELQRIFPEIKSMSQAEISKYFGKTPIEDLLQGKIAKQSLWNFSYKPDSDWGEDDSSGKAVQPDHYPNVARPGGGYPEGKGKESDTPCKTCNQNNLVDGRCPLCDWPNSVSEPIKNFPLDPFRDDKAGIRAGSVKNSGSNKEWHWDDVSKGTANWENRDLANFVMFLNEEMQADIYPDTGFKQFMPKKVGDKVFQMIVDKNYKQFSRDLWILVDVYNKYVKEYNETTKDDDKMGYLDRNMDAKPIWDYLLDAFEIKKSRKNKLFKQKETPRKRPPNVLYVITSPVAIKIGITGSGLKTRLQGYKQQNRKQFKNNPEWQWHTDPDELREIPIEGPGGQSTLFFDQQFSPEYLNKFYNNAPYRPNRKIVRSADEQNEIIHYVSPEMNKKTAEIIEARIINWCRDDCMIQTSPIGEQKIGVLPVIKNEQGEEEKVAHMSESIPLNNLAGITPDLIAYFIGVMANGGGKVPDLGEHGREWLQSNFNISDENFTQMFSGEFGQELGLVNQPEQASEQEQVEQPYIDPNQQTLWNFEEPANAGYQRARPEEYTEQDIEDQESAMKWYELSGRGNQINMKAASWKGSWKFGGAPKVTPEEWVERWEKQGFTTTVERVKKGIQEHKGASTSAHVEGVCPNGHEVKTVLRKPGCIECSPARKNQGVEKMLNKHRKELIQWLKDPELSRGDIVKNELPKLGIKSSYETFRRYLKKNPELTKIERGFKKTLKPGEALAAIQKLIEDSRKENNGFATISIKEIADELGMSKSYVSSVVWNNELRTKEEGKYQQLLRSVGDPVKGDNWNTLIHEEGLIDALKELINFNLDPNNIENISIFDYQNWLNKVDMTNNRANRKFLFNKMIQVISENKLIEDFDLLDEYRKIKGRDKGRLNPERLEKGDDLIKFIEDKYKWLVPKGKGNYDPEVPGWFYLLESQAATKVGITNDLKRRMKEHSKSYPDNPELQWQLKESYGPIDGIIPLITEKRMKDWLKKELGIDISVEGIKGGDGWTETAAITAVSPELISFLSKTIINNDGEVPSKLENLSDQEIDLILNNTKLFDTELGKQLGVRQEPVDPNVIRQQVVTPPPVQQGQIPPVIQPENKAPSSKMPNAQPATDEELAQLAAEPGEGAWSNLNAETMVPDPTTGELITPEELARRQSKTSDHQGSTNWETWNTKVMIDNEYNLYIQSREMVKNFTPLNEFAIWATQAVIAPHNQQALEDAQEWNDIPYDERPTGREHMSEGGQALTEGFDEIFGMDPRADETASIIDESKVDWPQIYNSIAEDIKESERFDHEEGKHDLLTQMYMTDFTAEELGDLQEETYPWCPICKVEHPDDPGDLTIPSDWTQ